MTQDKEAVDSEKSTQTYLELYKTFRGEIIANSGLHYQHFQRYLTLITALLVATIIGFIKAESTDGSLLVAIFSVVAGIGNTGICYLGSKMCDNHYLGMMEMVVASAKMEALLGLIGPRPGKDHPPGSFPADNSIMPERWITERSKNTSSAAFIKDRLNTSSNK